MNVVLNDIIMPFQEEYRILENQINPNQEQEIYSLYVKYLLSNFITEDQIEMIFDEFLISGDKSISSKIMLAILKSVSILRSGERISSATLKRPFRPPQFPSIPSNTNDFIITDSEMREFCDFFSNFEHINGQINGDQLKQFSLNSGLKQQTLYNIWTHVDVDGDGLISQGEFCVYFKLIKICQKEIPLPKHLPPSLLKYIRIGPKSPAANILCPKRCASSIKDLITFPPDFVPDADQQANINAIEKNLEKIQSVLKQIDQQKAKNDELNKELKHLMGVLEEKKILYRNIKNKKLESAPNQSKGIAGIF